MMKKTMAVLAIGGVLTISGCGLSNGVKGGGIGAVAGGLLGAGIGHVAGNTGVGAAIGAVVGGTAGALIGNKMDKQKRQLEEEMANAAKIESINDGQALRVTFDSGILFATGKATLSPSAQEALRAFARSAQANNLANIQIFGHTDNTGSDRVNDPLSVSRAQSVRDFLASQGIASNRMSFEGKGSRQPVADNGTAAGRKENRRVEVYVIPSQEMIEAAQNGTLR